MRESVTSISTPSTRVLMRARWNVSTQQLRVLVRQKGEFFKDFLCKVHKQCCACCFFAGLRYAQTTARAHAHEPTNHCCVCMCLCMFIAFALMFMFISLLFMLFIFCFSHYLCCCVLFVCCFADPLPPSSVHRALRCGCNLVLQGGAFLG